MKQFILIIILFTQLLLVYAQDKTDFKLIVTLENAPFDSLYLFDYTQDRRVLIPAQKTASFTWQFNIPDSIATDSEYMRLLVSRYDSKTNSMTNVSITSKLANREVKNGNVGLEDKTNHIYGFYQGRETFKEENISTKIDGRDTLIVGNMIIEYFTLMEDRSDGDILIRSKEPFFAWFMDDSELEKTYNDYLSSYVKLAKEHPDSRYLLTYLANNIKAFKSSDDVKLIFENLSTKHKNTSWYGSLLRYFTKQFDNMLLVNYKTGKQEKIVLDSTKYNFIAFSASYCIPCIEEIPLLKEIHSDLKDKLVFTYVSMDNKAQVDSFEKLLVDNGITWRSLYAFDKLKEVEKSYYINGIPHNILLTPDGKMEILDVRKEGDRTWMYEQVKL